MAATSNTTKNNISIPNWKISGDFFDVCNCNMPCPCEFAQAPTYDDCEGVLVLYSYVHNKQQIHFTLLLESVICNLEIVFSIIVIRDYT